MDFVPGVRVALDFAGEATRGAVSFVDGEWVHWRDDAGGRHASPRSALRVTYDDTRHGDLVSTHRTVCTQSAVDNGIVDTNGMSNGEARSSR
jgi:hypothetical protein